MTATIQHGRTVHVREVLPAPISGAQPGYTAIAMGDGRFALLDPRGERCGIAASEARANDTLRILNR